MSKRQYMGRIVNPSKRVGQNSDWIFQMIQCGCEELEFTCSGTLDFTKIKITEDIATLMQFLSSTRTIEVQAYKTEKREATTDNITFMQALQVAFKLQSEGKKDIRIHHKPQTPNSVAVLDKEIQDDLNRYTIDYWEDKFLTTTASGLYLAGNLWQVSYIDP